MSDRRGDRTRHPGDRRRTAAARHVLLVGVVALALTGGCGGGGPGQPTETAPVRLAEGTAADQPWRLEGRRAGGEPCVSLLLVGGDEPLTERCGIRRTPLRHLDPVTVPVDGRLVVFSPLPAGARRVRVDTPDGAIRVEPARRAPGFPDRFFVIDLDPGQRPLAVRVFADGGRAIVT